MRCFADIFTALHSSALRFFDINSSNKAEPY